MLAEGGGKERGGVNHRLGGGGEGGYLSGVPRFSSYSHLRSNSHQSAMGVPRKSKAPTALVSSTSTKGG